MVAIEKLIRSPIVQALVTMAAIALVLIYWLPDNIIDEAIDALAISGAVLVFYRFGCHAWAAVKKDRPSATDMLIAAMTGLAVSIGLLRFVRRLKMEFPALLSSDLFADVQSGISALLVFFLFLKLVAPPIHHHTRLTPWSAVIAAITCGTGLFFLMQIARRFYS